MMKQCDAAHDNVNEAKREVELMEAGFEPLAKVPRKAKASDEVAPAAGSRT